MNENDFYDDLSGALERSWRLLAEAIENPTSPVRTPVLISVGADGVAQGRTVVLRGINRQQRQLQIYTDVRSAKVAQLRAQSSGGLPAKSDDATAPWRRRYCQLQQRNHLRGMGRDARP